MRKLLNKNTRFENSIGIINLLFVIVYSIILIINKNFNSIRIFKNSVISIILLIISSLVLIFYILLMTCLKNKTSIKLKRSIYLITYLLMFISVCDLFLLGIVRTFIEVDGLTKRPTNEDPLRIRLAYLSIKNSKAILTGVWTTIWLSLAGTLVGLVLALIFICLRTLEVNDKDLEIVALFKKIGCGFVKVYVTVFRGTPMMVQAIIIYYFLPGILSSLFNVDVQVFNEFLTVGIAGFITVSLNTTAYLTEVLRGGIEALNKGQMEAARSLGMSRSKSMIYIILPQAIKNSLPSICNEFIINIKDTSVLSVISVMDLFFVIDAINGRYANNDGIFIAAIIYLCLTFGISKLLGLIEKKMNLVSKPLPSCN